MVNAPNSRSLAIAALRRSSSRRSERGAAVFIVVMAIVLLTGIGVFAVRTASMVDVAAGYDRQAMQTHHLSELAGRAAASDTSGIGDILQMMLNTRHMTAERCLANTRPGSTDDPTLVCFRIDHDRFVQRVDAASGEALLATQGAATDGSFGHRLGVADTFSTPLEGQILIEVTDPNHKGEGAGTMGALEVTVTAHAQVRPTGVGARPWCAPQSASMGASVQLLRAHLAIPQPKTSSQE